MKEGKIGPEAGREIEGKEDEVATKIEDLAEDLDLGIEKGAVQEIENEVNQENDGEVGPESEVEGTNQKIVKRRVGQADPPVGVEIKRYLPRKKIIMHHKLLATHSPGPVPEVRTGKWVM